MWTTAAFDDKLGLIYAPLGNTTPDYYGVNRPAFADQYNATLVALDVTTGREKWKFQTVHHDIWDYDLPAQPVLIDLPDGNGVTVPALLQTTKRGQLFLLDRRTGTPLAEVQEKPVPQQGGVPEEKLSPTQPYSVGMLSIARSLAMVASNNTVVFEFGPDHDKLLALGGGAWVFGIANPVLYMVVLALITGFVLRWTKFGRYVFAIGGNEHAATLTGVPVPRIKVIVYMISALSAGVAGIIQTGWLGAVTTNIGAGMELQVIAAAVIGGANLAGGVGTAFGALVGAALIEVIRNSLGLLGINAFWQGCFIGGAIVLAVLFDRLRNLRQGE